MVTIEAVDFDVYTDTQLLEYTNEIRDLYRYFKDAGNDPAMTMAKCELDRAEGELSDRGLSI